jgi:hypothetical protein
MSLSTHWFELAITDRGGTFRGMEIDMPLRDALALEPGEVTRAKDHVLVRDRLDDAAWSEVEIRFARRRGLDRVVSVRFSIETDRHFSDAEATFERLRQHFARELGPAAPEAPVAVTGARIKRSSWRAQGRTLPTHLALELHDGADDLSVRKACLSIAIARAA